MRSKVKFSIITSVALIGIASFVILISCGGLGDLIPDIVLDTIWDVLGYNRPANLNALALSESQVLLTWEDKVTGEDGFVVEYSTDGNNFSELVTAAKNSINYFHTGLDSNTFYFYKVYAGSAYYLSAEFAVLYKLFNLTCSQPVAYYLRVPVSGHIRC